VYCPGRSTCFAAADFNEGQHLVGDFPQGPWGWNIQYNASEGTVDNCEIWMGAVDCDFSQGQKVGSAVISPGNFHYCIQLPGYKSKEFQLYAGMCVGNDAAAHLDSSEGCNATDVAQFARAVEEYPLVHEKTEFVDTFSFDFSYKSSGMWEDYNVFPLGSSTRTYLSAHLQICQVADSYEPSTEPSAMPISFPATEPTVRPSAAPSTGPSKEPTKPSGSSALSPTASPSISFGADDDDDGCQEAFVYCPGRSTCFTDPAFNDGTTVFAESAARAWGWSIEYNSEDGVVDDCEIWVGATDCDFSNGKKVGTAMITEKLFYFCLDLNEWKSDKFYLYSGTCVASDGGNSLSSDTGSCRPEDIAAHARSFEEYPMVSEGGPNVSIFSFLSNQDQASGFWGQDYPAFPLGTPTTNFLSAYTYTCPCIH
jgi:hypothetical protein